MRTQESRTEKIKYIDPFTVTNKDPNFSYSWQRRKTVEEGGGSTFDGWEPVGAKNHNGETWEGPKGYSPQGGNKQFLNQDVILCKRPKEVSVYYKSSAIEKRNSQIRFINSVAQNAKDKLREIDPRATLEDNSKGIPQEYTQKTGKTE